MKKYIIIFLVVIVVVITLASGVKVENEYEYLRIHIRANSNLEVDQAVKYEIKDQIVDFLVPYLADCQTKEQSQNIINQNLKQIEQIANSALKQKNFSYTSKASIKNEYFPTRVYDDLVLESGNYDALIVELGSAEGDNWWCVVYPPLCFVSSNSKIVYKSKIVEIIETWKKSIDKNVQK